MVSNVKSKRPSIDFETEFSKGHRTYDHGVGHWWLSQTENKAHDKAYRNVVRYLKKHISCSPKRIIDYACGPGNLMLELYQAFPDAHIIGIDGSSEMIDLAEKRMIEFDADAPDRIEFWKSDLPNFELPRFKADLIVYCFPNICCGQQDQDYYDKNGALHRADRKVAKYLGQAREEDPEDETADSDSEEISTTLLDCKVVSRNLRGLINSAGICARVEYANGSRKELTRLVRRRQSFEQGCLRKSLGGSRPKRLFKRIRSGYFDSDVILDVYHQTGEKDDLTGGYQINILQAR